MSRETNFIEQPVVLREIIITTIGRRGNGEESPLRILTEFWEKDGTKLAEVDPVLEAYTHGGACAAELLQIAKAGQGKRDKMIHEMSLEKNERNAEIERLTEENRRLGGVLKQAADQQVRDCTEKRESEDRARQMEVAIRWAVRDYTMQESRNFEDWRNEILRRAGLQTATSTSLPAADLKS